MIFVTLNLISRKTTHPSISEKMPDLSKTNLVPAMTKNYSSKCKTINRSVPFKGFSEKTIK